MEENGRYFGRRSGRPGLTSRILTGLGAGMITGILLHYQAPSGWLRDTFLVDGLFYVAGNGFLRLMQMLVVPLVFVSLVCGSMSMGDTKKLGKIGVKTLIFYLVTTALAITEALLIAGMINPGLGVSLSGTGQAQVTTAERPEIAETLLAVIPLNPIRALADGEMLAVIFFALFVGITMASLGQKAEGLGKLFEAFNDVMMKMTEAVMKFAPWGVFCMVARTFSGIGFNAFLPLIKYMLAVLAALAVQCFFIYMIMLKGFTGLSPARFLEKFMPVMGFAFSTASSGAAIPMSIDILHEEMGVSKEIASFNIPLGATVNMDGTAIMQGAAVVFAAQAFGIPLSAADYLTVILTATMASVGTAGVPGVGLITLSMVFASVGLPVEAIAFIMGVDRILDMSRTAVNVAGDAVCTTIVAYQEDAVDREIFMGKKKSSNSVL